MKKQPLTKKQSELVGALRKQLSSLERDLAYHKEVLERFQQSAAWRWTGPVRRVVNLLRSFSNGRSAHPDAPNELIGHPESPDNDRFTGLCQVSFENFATSGALVETPRSEHPEIAAIFRELAAKEKEIARQKWVFERFLESPAWRWTAPIRWIAAQLPGAGDGYHSHRQATGEEAAGVGEVENSERAGEEIKAYVTDLCRESLHSFLHSGSSLELPQSERPAISIILVLFNRVELTFACLRSIAANCAVDSEVVIVDNASSDETPQLLDRLEGARITRNPDNRHFLAAANQGAHECRGDYVLLLNNDAQLLPGAVQAALQTLRSSPDIGAVGGRIILLDGSLQEAGSIVWRDGSCAGYGRGDEPFAPMYSFRRDVDYCSGAFLLTPRKVWNDLGGFDHAFEPAYYEETDYCMRLRERRLRVVYEPNATVLHYEFASSKSVAGAIGLQVRNQKHFAERHQKALLEHENPSADALFRARSRDTKKRILVIDDRVPHLWLGSGFPRANALIQALQHLGYFVTFYPIDVIAESWDQAYSDLPREVEIMLGSGRELLETFLRGRRDYYSKIIISRPHNMRLMAAIRKAHPEWFEDVDVIYDAEALFAEREISLSELSGRPMSSQAIKAAIAAEIQLTAAADRVVTVSERERSAFLSHGVRRVDVLGHSITPEAGNAPFDSREGLLFVGAVYDDLSPNADSLIWFLSQVLPRIRNRLGDIPVTIAGVNRSKRVQELAIPPVRLAGPVPSLAELYLRSRVFIAPTRYAAGIPHKVHEAAASGLPVVLTSLLASQLGWTDREVAIAQDANAFSEQCIDLYTNPSRWASLRHAALARVRQDCSPQVFEETLRRTLNASKGA